MAIVQDLSRLYSRRGKPTDTGIDRVERGIFEVFRQDPNNHFLIRLGKFYFLLQSDQIDALLAHPPRMRLADYWILRRAAIGFGHHEIDLQGFDQFWHIGHIAHGERFWQRLKSDGLHINILIHDVIPLDFPETCRADQLDKFKQSFDLWTKYADGILTPSKYSRDRILAHSAHKPEVFAHPLAVETVYDCSAVEPENAFVTLGTIEPRKNHILLLKIWQKLHAEMGAETPKLWIIGKRGWDNNEVFEFLDHSPLMNQCVFELSGVSDADLKRYLCRSQALLFPSIAEGFGLPFYEAILSNKSVLASQIPVFEENLKPASVKNLLDLNNFDAWFEKIRYFKNDQLELSQAPERNWEQYLAKVKTILAEHNH